MNETYLSFYLRANRIHVFIDALRGIGCPKFISFMIDETGRSLAMVPYDKKDFYSHRVPFSVYNGGKGMEVSSIRLCRILAREQNWDPEKSYRVPGDIIPKQKIALFYLTEAEEIRHDEGNMIWGRK